MYVITYLALFLHQFKEKPGQDNFSNSKLQNDRVNDRLIGGLQLGRYTKAQIIPGKSVVKDH